MTLMAGVRPERRQRYGSLVSANARDSDSPATRLQRAELESTPVEPPMLTSANGESDRLIQAHRQMKGFLDILNVGVGISTQQLTDYLECLDDRAVVAPGAYTYGSLRLLDGKGLAPEEFSRLSLIVLHYGLNEDDTASLIRLYSRFKTGRLIQLARRAADIHNDVRDRLAPLLRAAHRYSQREACMPEFQRLLRVISLQNEGILAGLNDGKAGQ